MRQAIKGFFLFSALIFFMAVVLPIKPVSAGAKGSETKGRYYFRQNCKTCHTKGAKGGEITPLSKTQAQWKTYFATGKHATRTELLTKAMSDDQLRDVATYLVAHAADSPQPETCGK
jgi:mono/diheme cytochrome c family protein